MKLTIKSTGFKDAKILLDDKDISNRVLKAIVDLEGGCVPVVILKLHPDDIEIDGEFKALRDLKERNQEENEKTVNITINSPNISDDVMKEIVDRLSKANKDRTIC